MRCRWCRCEGQAWGMRGAVPPAAWAFAILVASDMLFLRRFPGEFAPFAFSHSVENGTCNLGRLREREGTGRGGWMEFIDRKPALLEKQTLPKGGHSSTL